MAKYLHSSPNIWSRRSGDILLGVSCFCVSFQKIYLVIYQDNSSKKPTQMVKSTPTSKKHLKNHFQCR